MREGEVQDKDYHFIKKDDFLKSLENGEFLEYREYHTNVAGKPDTWYYGMTKAEVERVENPIVILDLQGAKAFQDYFGKENCITIYIHASDKTRQERAESRGSFDKTEWNRRLKDDNKVFNEKALYEICDDCIVNEGCTLSEFKDLFNSIYYHTKVGRELDKEDREDMEGVER